MERNQKDSGLNKFSERLDFMMGLRKMTQDALSAATGVSQATISRYLSGQVEPRLDEARRLAGALRLTLHELLGADIANAMAAAEAETKGKKYDTPEIAEETLVANEPETPEAEYKVAATAEVALRKLFRRNRSLHELLTRQIVVAERFDAEERERKRKK
jgi:transcriptional regulator with XRE-family HTH domain